MTPREWMGATEMTPEQAMQAGRAFAEEHLKVIEAHYGRAVAAAYAQGYGWAGRDYIYRNISQRVAYDVFADLADGAIINILPEGA